MARKSSRVDDVVVRPPSDAYTGLLALSLIAMIVSCVVLYLDYAQYGNTKAPAPNVPPVTKPAPAGTTAIPMPNTFAADSSEPLPLPVMPTAEPLVPVSGQVPADGPSLTPVD